MPKCRGRLLSINFINHHSNCLLMQKEQKKNLSPQEQFVQDMLESASKTQTKTVANKCDVNVNEIENITDSLKKRMWNR